MNMESILIRQKQALGLLQSLLDEEFEALLSGSPQTVSSLEFSIQELVRQLMDEKEFMSAEVRKAGFADTAEYIDSLDQGESSALKEIVKDLKGMEEECSRQAMKNFHMAQALAEQSSGLLNMLFANVTPRKEDVYSSRGRWHEPGVKSSGLLRGST
ncbi:MAG: flagellar export chaperone FlgN [Desulfonatronovibrionaceae bacterium]